MPEPKALVPVFVPSLANILALSEQKKGSPLTASEVESIRNKSTCIMMEPADAAKMDESRGFIDVYPKNCWADWHRLRAQMVGGYLPKTILCVPGDSEFRARSEPILRSEKIEYEFRSHEEKLANSFRSSSIAWPAFTPDDFARIGAHQTVLYVVSDQLVPSAAPSIGSAFVHLGKRLLQAGGIAIKSDSSGISHSAERWTAFSDRIAQNSSHLWPALFQAYVVHPIASNTDFYSCGMHLLGAPDLIVSQSTVQSVAPAGESVVAATAKLFRTFALYLLMECPTGRFCSGHTFSVDRDSPQYRIVWESCDGYPEDSYFFNPFGRWRFTSL